VGHPVFFNLLLGGLSRVNDSLDGLDLSVVVRLDVDLLASITFNHVERVHQCNPSPPPWCNRNCIFHTGLRGCD
jgi:hypothetical protein